MGLFKDTFAGQGKVIPVIQTENECYRFDYTLAIGGQEKDVERPSQQCTQIAYGGKPLLLGGKSTQVYRVQIHQLATMQRCKVAKRQWTVLGADSPEDWALGNTEISMAEYLVSFYLFPPPTLPHPYTTHHKFQSGLLLRVHTDC